MKKLLLLTFLMICTLGFSQTAAPTQPVRNSWDVISVFSGAYTDVGSNFFPNWGQGTTYEQVDFDGDTALHYTNLDYQGIEFNSPINAIGMTKLHIDIWTPNVTPFEVFLIAGGENSVTLTPTFSGWNSYDIDLATSYPNRTLNNIIQFKFQKSGFVYHGENNSISIDNLYFWRPATSLPPPTITGFSIPEQLLGTSTYTIATPTSNSTGAFTYSSSNPSVATITGNVINIIGLGSSTISASQAASGSYTSGIVFSNLIVAYPPPTTNAPEPADAPANVISVFSDSFTNVAGTDFFPYWGQNTIVSDYSVSGNNIKKYYNLNYQGVQFASPIDASTMTHLHLDVWTPDCTSFQVFLISNGENPVTLTPTASGWNSFDIDLSLYANAGRNLASIGQFKYVGTTGSTVYLDNVYFSNTPLSLAPTLSAFTIPTKYLGDANFALIAPTTNSSGAFTYSSSDTNVATISGNMVTIVGVGTSIITANQAAAGIYSAGSIDANLVVSSPTPTITGFSVPVKTIGDPSFTLTTPTSNSAGAFTYTSSNTSVATIVGNTVTIVGTGTSVITASQAAAGIYLSGSATSNLIVTSSVTAAPAPPARNAWDVISVFSNSYSDVGSDFFPNWGQGTSYQQVSIFGNSTLHYTNLDYQGVQFNTPIDASAMTKLHIDVWTANVTPFEVFLIAGGENSITLTPAASGWNSYDIDLATAYPTRTLNNVIQFKFVKTGFVFHGENNSIYIDNLYFWRPATYNTTIKSTLWNATVAPNTYLTYQSVSLLSGSAITKYGVEVTNLTTNAIGTLESTAKNFRLIDVLPLVSSYGTSFSVRVKLQINGSWSPYGIAKTVSTAALPPTANLNTYCGQTLPKIEQIMYCTQIPLATKYTFEVSQSTSSGTLTTTRVNTLNNFKLTDLDFNTFPVLYNKSYSVRIKVTTLINGDEVESAWSTSCTVTTPLNAPAISMTTGCGLVSSNYSLVKCTSIKYATEYKFVLVSAVNTLEIARPYNSFSFNTVSGAASSTLYTVTPSYKLYGQWYAGTSCDVTTPGSASAAKAEVTSRQVSSDFAVKAYPNPFAENFKLNVTSSIEEALQVKVYDMLGKLVENKELNVNDIETLEVGANYPSGVYNVVVSQGENVQSLRVVKR